MVPHEAERVTEKSSLSNVLGDQTEPRLVVGRIEEKRCAGDRVRRHVIQPCDLVPRETRHRTKYEHKGPRIDRIVALSFHTCRTFVTVHRPGRCSCTSSGTMFGVGLRANLARIRKWCQQRLDLRPQVLEVRW